MTSVASDIKSNSYFCRTMNTLKFQKYFSVPDVNQTLSRIVRMNSSELDVFFHLYA